MRPLCRRQAEGARCVIAGEFVAWMENKTCPLCAEGAGQIRSYAAGCRSAIPLIRELEEMAGSIDLPVLGAEIVEDIAHNQNVAAQKKPDH